MTHLQESVLKYLLRKPHTIDQTFKRLNRFRIRKIKRPYIERAFDYLECQYLIEELGADEMERLMKTGEETYGYIGDFSGYYIATEDLGVELCESLIEERRRFYLPLVISWLLTVISIAISILALVLSRG